MKKKSRFFMLACFILCTLCISSCSLSYKNIKGEYSNSSIDLTLWLYEDGTFTEHDRFGWYSGFYEYSKSNSDDYVIHLMSYYPPAWDTRPMLCSSYQIHEGGDTSKFVVLDQDGSRLQINSIVWEDSAGKVFYDIRKEGLYGGNIPQNAIKIAVNGNGGIGSGFVKVQEGSNIVFFVRPSYNRDNLRWTRKGGLVYKNENNIYPLKKSKLHPILKVRLPEKSNEIHQ